MTPKTPRTGVARTLPRVLGVLGVVVALLLGASSDAFAAYDQAAVSVRYAATQNGVTFDTPLEDLSTGQVAVNWTRAGSITSSVACVAYSASNVTWYQNGGSGGAGAFGSYQITGIGGSSSAPNRASATNLVVELRYWTSVTDSAGAGSGFCQATATSNADANAAGSGGSGTYKLGIDAAWAGAVPSKDATCQYGSLSGGQASYIDGGLWVSFRWLGAKTAGLAYPQFSLESVAGATIYQGAVYTAPGGLIATVDAAGYYEIREKPILTSSPGASVSVWFMPDTSSEVCPLQIAVSQTAIIKPGPPGGPDSYGGGADPATGDSCSTWDIFCRLKAAGSYLFKPSSSWQQWNDLQTTAKTHPPLSVVVGGFSFVNDTVTAMSASGSVSPCSVQGTPSTGCDTTFQAQDTTDSAHRADLLGSAGDLMQNSVAGGWIWQILRVGILGIGLLNIWRLVGDSFGSKGGGS